MIRGIHHTAISTRNLNRMLAFYRDLLGQRRSIFGEQVRPRTRRRS